MTPLLFALPWAGLLLFAVFVARIPGELPRRPRTRTSRAGGSVSIVVPARDEAVNIVPCLASLAAQEHPDFEIIVVDDRSGDGTADLARSVPAGNARRIDVVDGRELPPGWLGKPWACRQGAERATGTLLLFTDADTTHAPELLGRALAGLEEDDADLLTLTGTQLMETFWERMVQPHIFFMMLFRFPDFERTARNGRWREAIANGQYLLFTRTAYEAIGGHDAVKDEVVEDLALAQLVKRAGLNLRIRSAEGVLRTRMYRSLGSLVEGWSKNIAMGGMQSFPAWMRSVVPAVSFLGGAFLWLLPPAVLAVALAVGATGVTAGALAWSGTVYLISAALWAYFTRRMGAPAAYGLLYPLGAAVASFILLKSWWGGRDVVWKGRSYRLPPASERP